MSQPAFSSPPIHRTALMALGLSTLLPMLAGSMASMALPALGQAFSVPFPLLQWVLVAYLLGLTGLTVVAGRLGDRLGRRRLLCWGLALFALASLLCALAPDLGWLIGARALQGMGAACMLSLSLALVGQLLPAGRRGRGMGLLGTLSACGTALGPSFGGLLIGTFGWQAPFLLLVPSGLLALGLVLSGLPADRPTVRGEAPLPMRDLLRKPELRGGVIGSALVASVMVVTLLIGPFYLHEVCGLDLVRAGLWISGGPLLAALAGMPAGWLVDRVGAVRVVRIGLGAMLLAAFGLATLMLGAGPFGYLLPILLLTAGYALFQTANNSAVVGAAGEQSRGAVAGLLTLSRNLGQLAGAAGLGGLFGWLAADGDGAALTWAMQITFALAGALIGLALWLAGRRAASSVASAP